MQSPARYHTPRGDTFTCTDHNSSSSPSSIIQSSENQIASGSRLGSGVIVPTENPFSRVAFLAMALVPVIGTNMGPLGTNIGPIVGPIVGSLVGMKPCAVPAIINVEPTMRSSVGTEIRPAIEASEGPSDRPNNADLSVGTKEGSHSTTGSDAKEDSRVEHGRSLRPPPPCFVTHSCVPNAQLQGHIGEWGLKARLVALRRVGVNELIQCSAVEHFNQVSPHCQSDPPWPCLRFFVLVNYFLLLELIHAIGSIFRLNRAD